MSPSPNQASWRTAMPPRGAPTLRVASVVALRPTQADGGAQQRPVHVLAAGGDRSRPFFKGNLAGFPSSPLIWFNV